MLIDCRYRILSALNCEQDSENSKNINFFYGATETSKLTWRNPFGQWSTQSAISGQINQNAPGQP